MNFFRDIEYYCVFVFINNVIVGYIIFYCKLKGFKFFLLSIDSQLIVYDVVNEEKDREFKLKLNFNCCFIVYVIWVVIF